MRRIRTQEKTGESKSESECARTPHRVSASKRTGGRNDECPRCTQSSGTIWSRPRARRVDDNGGRGNGVRGFAPNGGGAPRVAAATTGTPWRLRDIGESTTPMERLQTGDQPIAS